MERATEDDDLVDCMLVLCSGKIKFQPVPKKMVDWIRYQYTIGNGPNFTITIDDIEYKCQLLYFAYIVGEVYLN